MEFYNLAPDELMHYGVRGMKWGVRRARKAIAKMPKLEQKESKAAYMRDYYDNKRYRAITKGSAQRYDKRYTQYKFQAAKYRRKIERGRMYVNKVNTKISKISKEDLDNGYEFCKEFMAETKDFKDRRI